MYIIFFSSIFPVDLSLIALGQDFFFPFQDHPDVGLCVFSVDGFPWPKRPPPQPSVERGFHLPRRAARRHSRRQGLLLRRAGRAGATGAHPGPPPRLPERPYHPGLPAAALWCARVPGLGDWEGVCFSCVYGCRWLCKSVGKCLRARVS